MELVRSRTQNFTIIDQEKQKPDRKSNEFFEPHDYRIYCVNIDLRHQYRISVAEAVPPGETSQAARSKEKPRGPPGGETTVFAG